MTLEINFCPNCGAEEVSRNGQTRHHKQNYKCRTIRQRVSRLVRKSLALSKKLENHIAAIWRFVHHYNANLQV
ncbi:MULTISPECIES: transposase-like zinc-binding domain-containing protein [unclassified Microcoleus]|uniref:transposase-like zinc-binding domain-containing protein n=1 Tax=unclassified Microcoleus TaxID=2642155 RepID=UPI004040B227